MIRLQGIRLLGYTVTVMTSVATADQNLTI